MTFEVSQKQPGQFWSATSFYLAHKNFQRWLHIWILIDTLSLLGNSKFTQVMSYEDILWNYVVAVQSVHVRGSIWILGFFTGSSNVHTGSFEVLDWWMGPKKKKYILSGSNQINPYVAPYIYMVPYTDAGWVNLRFALLCPSYMTKEAKSHSESTAEKKPHHHLVLGGVITEV